MLKRLLSNKKLLAVIIVVTLIVVGIVIAILAKPDPKSEGKPDENIKTELGQSQDDADDDGLQIKDEIDGAVDSVDASGSWDEPKNDTTQNEGSQNSGNGNQNENQNQDDTQDENNNNNNAEEGSDEEILEDDKEWGEIY